MERIKVNSQVMKVKVMKMGRVVILTFLATKSSQWTMKILVLISPASR